MVTQKRGFVKWKIRLNGLIKLTLCYKVWMFERPKYGPVKQSLYL